MREIDTAKNNNCCKLIDHNKSKLSNGMNSLWKLKKLR